MNKPILPLTLLLLATVTLAQDVASVLRPPKGAQVAIVVFEDLQCPDCSRANPLIEQAAHTYKIPIVIHDFPLPLHNWSYEAAVNARYFGSQSKQLETDYRDYIYQHQLEITPQNLRGYSERFAADHKTSLPFVVDPQGKFSAEINADRDLGKHIGIDHTPTIYLVSSKNPSKPFVEVRDRTQLFQMIDALKAE